MKKKNRIDLDNQPVELTEEQIANNNATQEEPKTELSIPWVGIIVIGVIILLMVACIIVIALNGGFN